MSYNSLNGLRLVTLEGLGAIDISRVEDVLEYHFDTMTAWTKGAIALEALTGKYDTLGKELSVALVDVCGYALSGLSADQLKAVLLSQLASLNGDTRTAILSEAISGNFTTLTKEFAKLAETACKEANNPGGGDQPNGNDDEKDETNGVKTDNTWMYYVGGALVLAGGIYYYTSKKPKSKKRGKK